MEAQLNKLELEKRGNYLEVNPIERKSSVVRYGSFFRHLVLPVQPWFARTYEQKKTRELGKLLRDSSKNFAFTIPMLPPGVEKATTIAYLLDRVIDTIADEKLLEEKEYRNKTPEVELARKKVIMSYFISTAKAEKKEDRERMKSELEKLLRDIKTDKRGYKRLLDDAPILTDYLQDLPPVMGADIMKYVAKMGEGFTNPEIVGNIETIEDHDRYCYWAAGLVGFQFTKILEHSKYISKEEAKQLMPYPNLQKPREGETNRANDFGLGLQKVNDIRDLFEDYEKEIYRWPKSLLREHGHDFNSLVNASTNEEIERGYKILRILVEDAKPRLYRANEYIDRMPFTPEGIRIFLGSVLGIAARALIETDQPEFFFSKGKIDLNQRLKSVNEIYDISEVVTQEVREGESLRPFLEHLLEERRPSYEFRNIKYKNRRVLESI